MRLVRSLIRSDADAAESFKASWANDSWTLGALLRHLAAHGDGKDKAELVTSDAVIRGVEIWHWSDHVMAGLADLAKTA